MSEVQADLDGIRVLGDLLRRQSQHVSEMADFLHEHCHATGAFDGVLLLLRPTYAQALGFATEGLQVSKDANQMLAERCEKTAQNYEKADHDNYLALARVAGNYQMTISAYRPAGSGVTTVMSGGPYMPKQEEGGGGFWDGVGAKIDAMSGAMTGAIAPVTGPVDNALKKYDEWMKPGVEAFQGASAETVLWNGKPVLADRLAAMHELKDGPNGTRFLPDGHDQQPDAFDKWHGAQSDRLKAAGKFVDPLGQLQGDLVDKASEKLGLGNNVVHNAATQHRINQGMEWTNNTLDTYGTVTSVAKDPTLGLRDLAGDVGEAVDTFKDVGHYIDVSNDKVDDSVARELRESR